MRVRTTFAMIGLSLSLVGPTWAADKDDDGVKNKDDVCPATDLSQTVHVGTCVSIVPDAVYPDGCSISQRLTAFCEDRGATVPSFKKCVKAEVNNARDSGLISKQEKNSILQSFQPCL